MVNNSPSGNGSILFGMPSPSISGSRLLGMSSPSISFGSTKLSSSKYDGYKISA